VTEVSAVFWLEFAMDIQHVLPYAVPAGMGDIEIEPPGICGVEVAGELHAWLSRIARGGMCDAKIR
jgi:hypothetical protein